MMNRQRFAPMIPTLGLALIMIATLACLKTTKMEAPMFSDSAKSAPPSQSLVSSPTPLADSMTATATQATVIQGTNQFGLDLLNELTLEAAGENSLISPASIAIALTMTLNGAAAETRQAIADTLGIGELGDEQINQAHLQIQQALTGEKHGITLTIANSLWARQGTTFESLFLDTNGRFFNARVQSLDFSSPEAAVTINKWVSEATKEKIPKIVDNPIDPSTILFLINAVYFKGNWTQPFDPALTVEEPFYTTADQSVPVPMMKREGHFDLRRDEDFQAVRLPYGEDRRLSMLLLLPRKGITPETLARDLTAEAIAGLGSGFRSMDGELKLPRFTMREELDLNPPLGALGMGIAFGGQADFQRMIAPPAKALINSVRHSTFIDVNEQGTEAAAVTSVMMALSAIMEKPVVVFDRPFLFMIRDEASGLILFMGIVNDPED